MNISNKLEEIQNILGITQKELAIKLGLSQNAISQYITGKRKPDVKTIKKLLDIGVSPLYLFYNYPVPFDKELDMLLKKHMQNSIKETIEKKQKEIENLKEEIKNLKLEVED